MTDAMIAIARAQAAYVRCIDADGLEAWPDFFTDPCFYQITTADNYRRGLPAGLIWADSKGMLTDRVSALREANIYERHTYRHMLGQPTVLAEAAEATEAGAREADSETPFLVLRITGDGPTDIFASGIYVDRYLIDGHHALLRRRVVVCDSSRIDTLLALPL
ncbi:MAG: aromatic-ring-hydroxylating dioxygenase subunit beta [Trebonia sp.]